MLMPRRRHLPPILFLFSCHACQPPFRAIACLIVFAAIFAATADYCRLRRRALFFDAMMLYFSR